MQNIESDNVIKVYHKYMFWDEYFLISACLILQLNNTVTVQQLLANVRYLSTQRLLSPEL